MKTQLIISIARALGKIRLIMREADGFRESLKKFR